jgi:hypothetical protein
MKDRVKGSLLYMQATLTGGIYLDMAGHFVYSQKEDLQPNFYSHEKFPPYSVLHVSEILGINFPYRWIKCNKPIYRQQCLPDIASLHFVLWGYVKSCAYAVRVLELSKLLASVRDLVASVTPDMLERTWQEAVNRFDIICTKICHMRKYDTNYFISSFLLHMLCSISFYFLK